MPTLREQYEFYCKNPEILRQETDAAVHVNLMHIERDLAGHAEAYLHWARMSAIAESEYESVELHTKEFVWPNCYAVARQAFEQAGEKATEKQIEANAMLDPSYQAQLDVLRNAKKIAATFKRIESAMWQRHSMLQSVNSRQCKEMSTLPGVGNDLDALKENARRITAKGQERGS